MSDDDLKTHKIIRKFTVTVTQEHETDYYTNVASCLTDLNVLRQWDFKTTSIQPATNTVNIVVMSATYSDAAAMDIDLSGRPSTITSIFKSWLGV